MEAGGGGASATGAAASTRGGGTLASARASSASTLSPSIGGGFQLAFSPGSENATGRALPMSFVSSAIVRASGGGGVGSSPAIAFRSRETCLLSSTRFETPNVWSRLSTSSPLSRSEPRRGGSFGGGGTLAGARRAAGL